MNNDKILLSVFVGVEGAHAFSAFMPSYFTVKKFATDPEDLRSLRSGYYPAILFNLALGLLVSVLIKDVRPMIISAMVSAFMIALYEHAVTQPEPEVFPNANEIQQSRI